MNEHQKEVGHCCETNSSSRKIDLLLWGSLTIIVIAYFAYWLGSSSFEDVKTLSVFTGTVFELINKMWFGLLLGIILVGLLNRVPREWVVAILGKSDGINGILRATGAGLLLDLCNHGILMVGMKLYERGASLGQVMAFLIASPWNSLSLTVILWTLVGFKWLMVFVLGSMVIALFSGLIFERLEKKGILPSNPNRIDLPKGFRLWPEVKRNARQFNWNGTVMANIAKQGLSGSRMVLRWILFGIILAGLVRALLPPDQFQTLFGPTLMGLGLTLLVATIIEVCSEGSVPIASDLLNQANAPGNAFAFLMAGVATDYNEIVVLKETTKSWKVSLFLPLITLPQVTLLAWLLNNI